MGHMDFDIIDCCCCCLENSNNQKLMAEYEKYQELQARSQRLQEVRGDKRMTQCLDKKGFVFYYVVLGQTMLL